jgi:hypothetical protein
MSDLQTQLYTALNRIKELEETCTDHGEIQHALCLQLSSLQKEVATLRNVLQVVYTEAIEMQQRSGGEFLLPSSVEPYLGVSHAEFIKGSKGT